jgi:hypothetical protein
MKVIRYLTFEISQACHLRNIHDKCPIGHPERYLYSKSTKTLDDATIIAFWQFCNDKGFRGGILWHHLNEPGHSLPRILRLQRIMRSVDPGQWFQLTTSLPELAEHPDFEIVKHSDYEGGKQLDDRILTRAGEGKPYEQMPRRGQCRRGLGWEVLIDNHGNWNLCCIDWRNEESFGSILEEDFEVIYQRWKEKSATIRWRNEAEYNALPRMCRSCLDINPAAGPFP